MVKLTSSYKSGTNNQLLSNSDIYRSVVWFLVSSKKLSGVSVLGALHFSASFRHMCAKVHTWVKPDILSLTAREIVCSHLLAVVAILANRNQTNWKLKLKSISTVNIICHKNRIKKYEKPKIPRANSWSRITEDCTENDIENERTQHTYRAYMLLANKCTYLYAFTSMCCVYSVIDSANDIRSMCFQSIQRHRSAHIQNVQPWMCLADKNSYTQPQGPFLARHSFATRKLFWCRCKCISKGRVTDSG